MRLPESIRRCRPAVAERCQWNPIIRKEIRRPKLPSVNRINLHGRKYPHKYKLTHTKMGIHIVAIGYVRAPICKFSMYVVSAPEPPRTEDAGGTRVTRRQKTRVATPTSTIASVATGWALSTASFLPFFLTTLSGMGIGRCLFSISRNAFANDRIPVWPVTVPYEAYRPWMSAPST